MGMYNEQYRVNIAIILKIASFFPRFVRDEANDILVEEVSKRDLESIMASFHMDKSPTLDGWNVKFLIGFYDMLEK
jgi:hypothetical protein